MSEQFKVSVANEKKFEKALKALEQKVSTSQSAAAPPKASSFVLSLFLSVFFEMLPLLLTSLSVKIMAKPKLVKVLEQTYVVIGGLLGKGKEEEEE